MTIPMLLLWSLTLAALCASIFALSAVLRSSDRSLSRQLSALSTRLREQEATLEELSGQLRSMRAREHMRAYRARKRGESPEDEPQSELELGGGRAWVQAMNEKLARARLGVSK